MKYKQFIGTFIQTLACILTAALIAIGLWAFLGDRYDPITGMHFDGFGRKLYSNAGCFGRDLSPGLIWEVADTGIAIVAFSIIVGLFSLGKKLKRSS